MNTTNKGTMLKKGTYLRQFQVCKHPIKIVSDIKEESEDTVSVCLVQEDLGLGRKFHNYLKSTSVETQGSTYFAEGRPGQDRHDKLSDQVIARNIVNRQTSLHTTTFETT